MHRDSPYWLKEHPGYNTPVVEPFQYRVTYYRPSTNHRYTETLIWDLGVPFTDFIWAHGNFACDCNRSMFMKIRPSLPCGDDEIYIERIVRVDTGEVLYSEDVPVKE